MWAQGTTFVVTGAQRVFVRRGPGTEFPPFATLTQGSTVEVQEMQGEWARIATGSGQVGYINSNFIAPPGEKVRASSSTPAAPEATPAAPHPEAAALHSLQERNKALEAEIRSLQEQLTELRNRAEAPPAPAAAPSAPAADPASGSIEQLHSELTRLATAVEGMQRRLDARPASEDVAPVTTGSSESTSHVVSPTAVLLGAIGLLVGWLFGSGYGRKQERGRRTRIRF